MNIVESATKYFNRANHWNVSLNGGNEMAPEGVRGVSSTFMYNDMYVFFSLKKNRLFYIGYTMD